MKDLLPVLAVSLFPLAAYLLRGPSQRREASVEIVELAIYPIKSCKGIKLQKALVALNGFKYDREWMVINEKNRFVSQRERPIMCFIGKGGRVAFQEHLLDFFVPFFLFSSSFFFLLSSFSFFYFFFFFFFYFFFFFFFFSNSF